MLTKKTSKNQLTLPKEIVKEFPDIDYFDAKVLDRKIVLTPVRMAAAHSEIDGVREKMAKLGVCDADVREAVEWARKRKR